MEKKSFLWDIYTSGVSVSIANIVTLPMDVLKVRLQLQQIQFSAAATTQMAGMQLAQVSRQPGLVMTGVDMIRNEGLPALYRGIYPAVARGLFYGGVRLGCYGPAKTLLGDTKENKSVVRNIAAGSLSGALAAWASNPIDLIKTRLQSKENPHRTSTAVVKSIVQTDGIRGLWRGTVPSTARAAVLTAAQCATYNEAKTAWMNVTNGGDTLSTHVGASMISGLVTTTLTAPVDVIKTNMFVGGNKYSGPIECATDILKREGPRGLLKGWTANYIRLGPQTTVIFVVMEKMRQLYGLDSL